MLDSVAIAVVAHLLCMLLPVLPVILLLALDFAADNRQSFCQQGAEALVEGAAENLQIMAITEVILGLPEFSDSRLQEWLAPPAWAWFVWMGWFYKPGKRACPLPSGGGTRD
ncbi:MAG: hypothetical protein WCH37_10795 [Synechococcaceae cyanobacterium ELA182]